MTHSNPDPDPDHTPGLKRGGGVPPGETPPAEGSMSEAGPRNDPPKGWGAGPLIAIGLFVVVMVIGVVAYAVLVHD